ncbi:hypothetical protein D3C81_1167820 [compost metagenome]
MHQAGIDRDMPVDLPEHVEGKLVAGVAPGLPGSTGDRDCRGRVDRVLGGVPPDEVPGHGKADPRRRFQGQRRLEIHHVRCAKQACLVEIGKLREQSAIGAKLAIAGIAVAAADGRLQPGARAPLRQLERIAGIGGNAPGKQILPAKAAELHKRFPIPVPGPVAAKDAPAG